MTDELNPAPAAQTVADQVAASPEGQELAAKSPPPTELFGAAGSMPRPSPEALAKSMDLGAVGPGPLVHERASPAADLILDKRDRAADLVAGYEHSMETNSPRTMAELNELKALLLGE